MTKSILKICAGLFALVPFSPLALGGTRCEIGGPLEGRYYVYVGGPSYEDPTTHKPESFESPAAADSRIQQLLKTGTCADKDKFQAPVCSISEVNGSYHITLWNGSTGWNFQDYETGRVIDFSNSQQAGQKALSLLTNGTCGSLRKDF